MDGERDLHVFLDAVDDMVVVATPDGRIVHANPALTKKLGYDSAEIRSMPMLDLHPPEVRAEAESIYAAMWRGERNTYPLPLQTRSGALLPVETRVWFGRWNGADCVFGICKDLTAEQEALQRFERLFRHNPALMAVSDLPERRFTDVNDAWLKTLGYAREEVLGRTSEELGLAVDPDEQRAVGAQLQAQGRMSDQELRVRRRDGTILDGLFFGEIIESQGQRDFLTVMIDQTERRQAEEALRESEERFRRISEATSDFAYSCVKQPGGSFTFDWVTGAVERITGLSHEELLALGCWRALVLEEDRPLFDERVIGVAPGDSAACELRIRDTHGDVRWLAVYSDAEHDAEDPAVHRLHGACRDTTERRRAEEALRESHDLLSNLTRLVPGVVYQYRLYPDGRSAFPYSSPGMNDIYEVTPEEVREDATLVFGRLHPDDAGRVGELIAESARTLEEFYCEFRVILPRQGLRWRWSQAHPERTEDGGTLWHGIISDVTERKLAEEALQREQHLMRTLMENVPDHIYFKDLGSRFVRVNDSQARALGLSDPGQAVGRTDFDFFTDEHARQAYEDEQEIIRTGQPNSREERETRAGLPDTWVSTTKMSLRDIDETIIGTFGISVDITERRRAAEALRESEERFQRVFDSTQDLISLLRPVRDEHGVLVDLVVEWANAKWRSWFGWDGRDPGGRQLLEVAPWLARMLPTYERVMATGVGEREDVQLPDGRWLDADYVAFGDGLLAVSRDVTERNRLAAQVLQSQKMETVGRLAGGVAHDFNNLLAVILGNAELARADLDPADPRRDALTEIDYAAHRGATLTRQLLAFSRQQVVAPEVLDIDSVVGEIEGMLRRLIGADIALAFEPGESVGRVRADRSQVGQVLMNLVVNARDAMPHGGTLRVETGTVVIAEGDAAHPPSLAPGRCVTVTVTDSGTGIDAETRKHLFEPFFTTKGPDEGSGLGLATAQGIARQAGGDLVCVASEPGHGSSFTLYLPATDDPVVAAAPAAIVTPVAPRAATILLVEDDAGVRRLGERVLAGAGYTVLTAADGAEALAVLAAYAGHVNLVVTDIVMPRMGGTELARRVVETHPGARILFTSGYPGDILTSEGTLPAGAAFIGKPYMPAELLAAVREVLAGQG